MLTSFLLALSHVADDGLDAADAGGGGLLLLDLEAAELLRVRDVRTAADLLRDVADRVERDLVAVLRAEERHRALGLRLLDRRHLLRDGDALLDPAVDEILKAAVDGHVARSPLARHVLCDDLEIPHRRIHAFAHEAKPPRRGACLQDGTVFLAVAEKHDAIGPTDENELVIAAVAQMEVEAGVVQIKNLSSGEQRSFGKEDLQQMLDFLK